MSNQQLEWKKLLCESRRKSEARKNNNNSKEIENTEVDPRTEIERDFDRILFSTPVRRLADKTQVFPLDRNDSVRTRLTHSNEVSNLSRSIGTSLVYRHSIGSSIENYQRNIPAILAAVGLAHDIGNPPFGHQGEAAIQSWFKQHRRRLINGNLTIQQQQDFLRFEGNAQGFRLLTRLQLLNDNFGLDLTYATLAALMKYPCGSHEVDRSIAAKKKHGYFFSEQEIAQSIYNRTGISVGTRHPLAFVMEACDDIAYVVLDVEDAVKKGLASFSDIISYLRHHASGDPLTESVVYASRQKHDEYRKSDLSPAELNDVSMQRFRVYAIGALIRAATVAFAENQENFLAARIAAPLLSVSAGEKLRSALKDFAAKHAYSNRAVLKVELEGYSCIRRLMDIFWDAIVNREEPMQPKSRRKHPYSRFVYGIISENYRRVFEDDDNKMPVRYKEFQLLTDMISGMTDSYAINIRDELDGLIGEYRLSVGE